MDKFILSLDSNRAGRLIQDHLASTEDRLDAQGREGAVKEVVTNRQVFMSALALSLARGAALPCGLPKNPPKYVAILNLSGSRVMVTTSSPCLMYALCARNWAVPPSAVQKKLKAFEDVSDANTFVLILFSLPWQSGLGCSYWELNTVELLGHVARDRELTFTSISTDVFSTRSTALVAGNSVQVKAFVDSYSSVSLDMEQDTTGKTLEGDESTQSARTVEASLRSIIAALKEARVRDASELKQLRVDIVALEASVEAKKEKLSAEAADAAERTELAAQVADAQAAEAAAEMVALRKGGERHAELERQLEEARRKNERLKKAEAKKNDLQNATLSKLGREKALLEEALEAEREACAASLHEQAAAHAAAVEALNGEFEKKGVALADALASKKKICNQLAEMNDIAQCEAAELRERIGELRAAQLEPAKAAATQTGTRTQGTSTHMAGETQTSDARIVPADLPEELAAKLPVPVQQPQPHPQVLPQVQQQRQMPPTPDMIAASATQSVHALLEIARVGFYAAQPQYPMYPYNYFPN